VQVVGDRSVVYVANPARPGQFVERVVETGATVGDAIEIRSGVAPGEVIVAKGSFAVRAEAERLGVRAMPQTIPSQAGMRITVSDKGFEPSRVTLRAGVPTRLTFVRTTDSTCATEIAIPSLNIKRALPLNQPVAVDFTPEKPGDLAFACGMNMLSGTLVIQ
jgi:hypothetical protein